MAANAMRPDVKRFFDFLELAGGGQLKSLVTIFTDPMRGLMTGAFTLVRFSTTSSPGTSVHARRPSCSVA